MNDLQPASRDSLLQEIKDFLPQPILEETQDDGSIRFIGGEPGEVVVRINDDKSSVAEFSVKWEGPHTPVVRPKQLATMNWRRLPASSRFPRALSFVLAHGGVPLDSILPASLQVR